MRKYLITANGIGYALVNWGCCFHPLKYNMLQKAAHLLSLYIYKVLSLNRKT